MTFNYATERAPHHLVSAPDPNQPQRGSLPVPRVILDAIRAGVGLGLGPRLHTTQKVYDDFLPALPPCSTVVNAGRSAIERHKHVSTRVTHLTLLLDLHGAAFSTIRFQPLPRECVSKINDVKLDYAGQLR